MTNTSERKRAALTGASLALSILLAACAPAAAPPSPTAAPAKPTAAAVPAATVPPPPTTVAPPTSKPVAAPTADTEAVARHFAGKTVTMTVGYAPGGGHDTYTRMLAAHMDRHIPGNPKVVVTNMPGADSFLSARATQQSAPDGLNIGEFHISQVLQPLLGKKQEGFDPTQLIYLGNPDNVRAPSQVCARADVAKDLDTFMKSPRKLKAGETGPGTNPGPLMEWLAVVGMPVEVVYGYGGGSEVQAAFERKELDLNSRCTDDDLKIFPHWATDGSVTPLFYFDTGPEWSTGANAAKYPWNKEVRQVATMTPLQQRTLETYLSWRGTRTYAISPRTPEPIAAALQKAFADTVNDPAVQRDLKERAFDVGLRTGDDLRKQIADFVNMPEDVLALYKQIHLIKD